MHMQDLTVLLCSSLAHTRVRRSKVPRLGHMQLAQSLSVAAPLCSCAPWACVVETEPTGTCATT